MSVHLYFDNTVTVFGIEPRISKINDFSDILQGGTLNSDWQGLTENVNSGNSWTSNLKPQFPYTTTCTICVQL